jgi:hypothetical protein
MTKKGVTPPAASRNAVSDQTSERIEAALAWAVRHPWWIIGALVTLSLVLALAQRTL